MCPTIHCCCPLAGLCSPCVAYCLSNTLSMMCFVPLQPRLSTLFSPFTLGPNKDACQDRNLKDLRTITLSTHHHVTQRQAVKERRARHKTSDSRLKSCSVALSILLHIHTSLLRDVSASDVLNERHTNTPNLDLHATFHKTEKQPPPKSERKCFFASVSWIRPKIIK